MISCPKCFKENQDHYKFCLGCGAELPREASPKKFAAGTPPQGVPTTAKTSGIGDESTTLGTGIAAMARAASEAPAPATTAGTSAAPAGPQPFFVPVSTGPGPATPAGPPGPVATPSPPAAATPAPAAKPAVRPTPPPPVGALSAAPPTKPSAEVGATPNICPQCSQPNPANNKFCASCGFRLSKPPPAPPAASAADAGPTAATTTSAAVLTALRADGTEAGAYSLPGTATLIGRDTGAIFGGDSYLSPRHATFTPRNGKLYVKDEGSLNGVYRKLKRDDPVLVNYGDIFRIGQEIVRFDPLTPLPATPDGVERLGSPAKGYVGRIAMIIGRDTTGNAYPVPEMGLHLGRERGDVLFPEDGYVSGLHCRIAWQNGQLFLTDLGSSNGTFIRLVNEAEVHNGDILLMGQQLFRVTI